MFRPERWRANGRGLASLLGIAGVVLLCGTLPAQVWLEWNDVTASNIVADPAQGANDLEEKDLISADFDQDGDPDLICVRKLPFTTFGNRSNVLYMNVNGVLTEMTSQYAPGLLTPDNARDVMTGDFNNDGWIDFIVANAGNDASNGQQPRIFMNLGSDMTGWLGFLEEPARLPFLVSGSGSEPNACAVGVGDLNNDGFDDLYLVDYLNDMEDRLLMNDGTGFFVDQTAILPAGFVTSGFATAGLIADMNGDGWPEILKDTTPTLRIAYNDGAGGFSVSQEPSVSAMYHFDVGDLDGDNLNDVFAVQDPQDQFLINASPIGMSPVNWQNTPVGNSPLTTGFGGNVYIQDLDGDGDNDVTVTDVDTDVGGCSRRMAFLRNDGGSPVQISDPYGAGPYTPTHHTGTYDVALADFNGDGAIDIWVGHCGGNNLYFQTSNIPGLVPPTNFTCPQVGLGVEITWMNSESYDSLTIRRDGVVIGNLAGSATSFTDPSPGTGNRSYTLIATAGGTDSAPVACAVQVSLVDPVLSLTCDQIDVDVQLNWVNQAPIAGGTYSGIRLIRNGIDLALLPGTATSYLDLAPAFGLAAYQVIPLAGTDEAAPGICNVAVIPTNLTDLVIGFTDDDAGMTDSTTALQTALADNGIFSVIAEVDDIGDVAGLGYILGDFERLWVELGTFPNDKSLSPTEAQALADYVNGGGNLYISGGDFFCFDTATVLHALTGIDTDACPDGGASVANVLGVPATDCDLQSFSALAVDYVGEAVFVDELGPLTTGLTVLRADNDSFNAGVLNVLPGAGSIISQSVEMGGIGAPHDKKDLVERYISCFLGGGPPAPAAEFSASTLMGDAPLDVTFTNLSSGAIDTYEWDFGDGGMSSDESPSYTFMSAGTFTVTLTVTGAGGSDSTSVDVMVNAVVMEPGFIRGDSDGDFAVNIGDAVGSLSYVFGGVIPGLCLNALDANDDELLDISDPIYVLSYLFSGGPEPAAPFSECGTDPTAGAQPCDSDPCP